MRRRGQQHAPVAGGGGPDLRPSEEKLPASQASPGLARDAFGTEDALIATLQGLGFSGRLNTAFIERVNLTVRHGIASSGPPDLGHVPTGSTAACPPGVVASVLPFCPSS